MTETVQASPDIEAMAREMEILFPDREVTVNGEQIIVREITFVDGVKLAGAARPLIEALDAITQDQDCTLLDIEQAFAEHWSVTEPLLAAAIGKPVDWLRTLNDREGRELLLTFWTVNNDFFLSRMVTLKLQQLKGIASPTSSAH